MANSRIGVSSLSSSFYLYPHACFVCRSLGVIQRTVEEEVIGGSLPFFRVDLRLADLQVGGENVVPTQLWSGPDEYAVDGFLKDNLALQSEFLRSLLRKMNAIGSLPPLDA